MKKKYIFCERCGGNAPADKRTKVKYGWNTLVLDLDNKWKPLDLSGLDNVELISFKYKGKEYDFILRKPKCPSSTKIKIQK